MQFFYSKYAKQPKNGKSGSQKDKSDTAIDFFAACGYDIFIQQRLKEGEPLMVATAKSFLEALERNKWRSKDVKDQENGNTVVVCGVTGKTVQVDFQFFFDKNEHTVAIRIFNLFLTPVDKWMQVMEQKQRQVSHVR